MGESPLLVELCAGSAAVAMRALGNAPPTRYMGGKKRFAKQILAALRVEDLPARVLLVDPGPWGTVWETLPGNHDDVCALLDDWIGETPDDHERLWRAIAAARRPACPVEYTAGYLVLQTLSWRSKPVTETPGGGWKTAGIAGTMLRGCAATPRFGGVRPQLPTLIPRLRSLQHLDRVEGRRCRAEEVDPFPAVAYVDPPYSATQGYGHDLARCDVVALVHRWRSAGARVGVSEAEPIGGLGGARVQLGKRGKSSALSKGKKQREEWLSVSFEPGSEGLFPARFERATVEA